MAAATVTLSVVSRLQLLLFEASMLLASDPLLLAFPLPVAPGPKLVTACKSHAFQILLVYAVYKCPLILPQHTKMSLHADHCNSKH